MASVNIPSQTIMQERTPEAGRARVLSLQFMLYSTGAIPVLLFSGAVAQLLGFSQVVWVVAAGVIVFFIWGVYYLRNTMRDDEIDGQQVSRHENKS